MKKNIILVVGPQGSGNKLTASIFLKFFGCDGDQGGGFAPPKPDSDKIVYTNSVPTGSSEGEVVDAVYFKPLERNIGVISFNRLLAKVRDMYGDCQINVVCPIRDHETTVKSLMSQGMEREAAQEIHKLSLEWVIKCLKECYEEKNVFFNWLSYEFLTYDTETCLKSLSEQIGIPIVLSEQDFKDTCKKIVPRNKYHYNENERGKYLPANHNV